MSIRINFMHYMSTEAATRGLGHQRPRPATLLKKSLWHRCFPVNFAKFLRISFLQSTFGRLLLEAEKSNVRGSF